MTSQPPFRRSSYCGTNACVEIATDPAGARMRDSKLTDSPILTFPADGWSPFLKAVKAGAFDLQ